MLGSWPAVAWVVLIGFAAVAPLAAIQGMPDASAGEWGWTLVAGAGSAGGIAFVYGALRQGQVSIVTPIVAADGAVAAALAIGAGEEIGLLDGRRAGRRVPRHGGRR